MKNEQKNSIHVWDEVWSDPGLNTQNKIILETERATIRWSRVKKTALSEFSSMKDLQVIEIGSGIGTYAGLFASEGAKATLLDFSTKALQRAQYFFKSNNLSANYVQGDALNIPKSLKNKFDISISVGLTEHFKETERLKINKNHFSVLKKGGIAIIMVPNTYNFPYRIYKFVAELFGTWKFGEEYPYTRSELKLICSLLNHKIIALFGDDLYQSIKFLLPANFLRRFFKVGMPKSLSGIRKEKGTLFDNYFGYTLILIAKN